MANFKPFASYTISQYRANRENLKSNYLTRYFKTYRELVKAIPEMTGDSYDDEINVTRSRRGKWGEWFETWKNGVKIEEGWM